MSFPSVVGICHPTHIWRDSGSGGFTRLKFEQVTQQPDGHFTFVLFTFDPEKGTVSRYTLGINAQPGPNVERPALPEEHAFFASAMLTGAVDDLEYSDPPF